MKSFSSCALNNLLGTSFIGRQAYFLKSAVSTQDVAKKLAASGAEEGAVVIAESQTGGRGRRGSRWASPRGGLWLSAVFYPPADISPAMLTLAGAAAAAGAIERTAGLKAVIKWPNDCFVNGKKAAGVIGEKSGEAVILGIGVNLNIDPCSLPGALKAAAASISAEKGSDVDENDFLSEMLKELEFLYSGVCSGDPEDLFSRLKELSGVPGRSVSGISGGRRVDGTAVGFGEDGSLIIRLDSGVYVNFTAGELALEKEGIGC